MTRDEALDRMRASTTALHEREEWVEKERVAAEVAATLLWPPVFSSNTFTTCTAMGKVSMTKASSAYIYGVVAVSLFKP